IYFRGVNHPVPLVVLAPMTASLTYRFSPSIRHSPMRIGLLLVLLFAVRRHVSAESEWELRTEKQDIKVYTRTFPDSKFKAIKVELILQTTMSRLVTVLLDVNAAPGWGYA